MNDSPSSFGSTITSGIQDITAILPLLGTEQCERHTETGLSKGFLYTAMTPISIFGSLGIVKAGVTVLILAIPRRRGFWGAKFLANGGFKLEGPMASIISCDPKRPDKCLAESEFQKLVENAHADVNNLSINRADKAWNISMTISTLIISSVGYIPYIYITHNSESPYQSSLLPLFPAVRILGSAFTCILVQIIIQIRVLAIAKTRLIFMQMDHYIQNSMKEDDRETFLRDAPQWKASAPSELCLLELQRFLATRIPKHVPGDALDTGSSCKWAASLMFSSAFKGLPTTRQHLAPQITSSRIISTGNNTSKHDTWTALEHHLFKTQLSHFPQSLSRTIKQMMTPWLLALMLLVSIAGYIGTFNFVQQSDQNAGPIVWLVLEGVLCVVRIVVWGWNPSWDDNPGIRLSYSKTTKSPLLTSTISIEDMAQISTAKNSKVHLVQSQDFLEDIAFLSSPLPTFSPDGTSLYYFLAVSQTHKGRPNTDMIKVLCILLCDYEEQTSRLIFKNTGQDDFKYMIPENYRSHGMRGAPMSTIGLQNVHETTKETSALTSNPQFQAQLTKHYNNIMDHMDQETNKIANANHFVASWLLQTAYSDSDSLNTHLLHVRFSPADQYYFDYNQFEAQRDIQAVHLAAWVQGYLKAYTRRLVCELPADMSDRTTELLEVMHLITTVAGILEKGLISSYTNWKVIGDEMHDTMVSNIMVYFESGELKSLEGKTKYTDKLTRRLSMEKEQRAAYTCKTDFNNMKERIRKEMDGLAQAAEAALHTSSYAAIIDLWSDHLGLNDLWAAYRRGHSANILSIGSHHLDDFAVFVSNMNQRLSDNPQVLERCRLRVKQWQMFFESTIAPYLLLYNPVHHDSGIYTWGTELEDRYEFSSTIAKAHAQGMDPRKHISLVVSNSLIECLGNLESIIALIKWFAIPVLYFDFNTPVAPTEDLSKDDILPELRAYNQDIKLSDLDLTIYQILKHCSCVIDIHFSDKNYSVPKLLTKTIGQHTYNILMQEPGFQYVVRFKNVDFSNHQGSLFESYVKLKKSDSSKCIIPFWLPSYDHNYTLSLTYRLTMADETKSKVIPISTKDWRSREDSGKIEVHGGFAISVHFEQFGYRTQHLNIGIKLHGDPDEIYLLNVDLTENPPPTDDSD